MLQKRSVPNSMEESEASSFTERNQTIRPTVIILINLLPKCLREVFQEDFKEPSENSSGGCWRVEPVAIWI